MERKTNDWLEKFNLSHPLVIAGPCSAETEQQVLKIAHQLKETDVTVFRAGIWKPRTRPGNFEGVGSIGLKWLQRVKKETGLLTATEVANKDHVKLALEHDIDVLWIGARSTVSPFIVQEIADSLNGTEKIVLVKNPVNPDLSLWLGAVERLQSANISRLGLIHRGFSSQGKSKYRNNPEWQIAIEAKNKFPDVPIICDPSHISGRRDLIFDLSQMALDLNFDGLMIESHTDPDNAWSDAAQQVTPNRLIQIMKDLKIRNTTIEQKDYVDECEIKYTTPADIYNSKKVSCNNSKIIKDAIKSLNPIETKVVDYLYFNSCDLKFSEKIKDLKNKLNVSDKRIYFIHSTIIKKLKKVIENKVDVFTR